MKRHVILSGPSGSGKTHIAKALLLQYPPSQTTQCCYSIKQRELALRTDSKVLIFYECESLEQMKQAADNLDSVFDKSLIFTTQEHIDANHDLAKDFHVINCRNWAR